MCRTCAKIEYWVTASPPKSNPMQSELHSENGNPPEPASLRCLPTVDVQVGCRQAQVHIRADCCLF